MTSIDLAKDLETRGGGGGDLLVDTNDYQKRPTREKDKIESISSTADITKNAIQETPHIAKIRRRK